MSDLCTGAQSRTHHHSLGNLFTPTQQGIVAWPVAKLLEFVLGSHHGIIYRRAGMSRNCLPPLWSSSCAELKELIALHSSSQQHGGDLKMDTVTIIGATLDLQEKVVREVRHIAPKKKVPRPNQLGNDSHRGRVYAIH